MLRTFLCAYCYHLCEYTCASVLYLGGREKTFLIKLINISLSLLVPVPYLVFKLIHSLLSMIPSTGETLLGAFLIWLMFFNFQHFRLVLLQHFLLLKSPSYLASNSLFYFSVFLIGSLSWKVICMSSCISELFTIAKRWKKLKLLSVGEWIKKMDHLHNGRQPLNRLKSWGNHGSIHL